MTNISFSLLIICVVVIVSLVVFSIRTLIALDEKKLELEMEREDRDSEVKKRVKSVFCKGHLIEKELSPSSFNTLAYYRGRTEGTREAVKAVKAIKEFSKRNYLDTPQRLIDFMSGVLEECERQLRYNEATCIKAINEERVLSRDERDEQQYGILLTSDAADSDDTP